MEQVKIIQNETSSESVFWFGAHWNSTMQEYISEKGFLHNFASVTMIKFLRWFDSDRLGHSK